MGKRAQRRHYFSSTALGPDNDVRSYAAELLVTRSYGLPDPAPDSIAAHDLILPAYEGGAATPVGVKSTRHPDGGLYVIASQHLHSLAYVLVTGEGDAMRIRGFAWRFQLEKAPLIDKGFGLGHYLEQSALRNLDVLMALHGLLRQQ